jgi:acyl-coenzyme A synthetase/AMP-(fatty) acid ligase
MDKAIRLWDSYHFTMSSVSFPPPPFFFFCWLKMALNPFTSALNLLIHGTIYGGYTLIVMAKFDLENFCKLIQDHKATFAYLVPPVALLLSKHPLVDKYNLSSLRMVMSAAAPMTRELAVAMYDRIKVPIKQAYGLTETSPGAIVQVSLVSDMEG